MKKSRVIICVLVCLSAILGGCSSGSVGIQDTTLPTRIETPDFHGNGTESGNAEGTDVNSGFSTTDNASNRGDENTNHTTAPVTTAKPQITKPSPSDLQNGESRVKFLAAGDNIIHANVFTDAMNRAKNGEKYNFIDMYKDIADFIDTADLKFVNQETPLGGDQLGIYGYPTFNGPQAAGDALVELGFNIVNIATNHMLDMKEKGLIGHIEYWNSKPVTLLGGYLDDEDYENIRVVEQNGIKTSFISYTYGLNGMTLPASSKIHIPLIDEKEIVRMVKKAREVSDCVIVVMHWGTDSQIKANDQQKKLAKSISAAGADVILGMHSHTVQPVEWINNPDGSRTLVIYSLGNLISTMYDNYCMVGGIMTFDIVKDKSGKITIEKPIYNPVVTHYDKDRLSLQVYLLKDYTDEIAATHGTVYYGSDKRWSVDIAKSFVTKQITDEFLPDFMKSK